MITKKQFEDAKKSVEQYENQNSNVDIGLGICKEKGCENHATKDYNGHGYYVCDYHYEKLNDYFDEEFD